MENKQLINGGQASNTNINYWGSSLVTVASDHVTHFYKLINNSHMNQTSYMPTSGNIRVSFTYRVATFNGSIKINIVATMDDNSIINLILDASSTKLDTWAAFEKVIEPDDAKKVISLYMRISYTGDSYAAIANISAVSYYTDIAGSISSNDFIEKSILYGLDEDKPTLGTDKE